MGRKKWQWLAVVWLLCAVAVSVGSIAWCEEETKDCPTGTCPYAQPDPEDTEEDVKDKEELPPLDLGTGTTADSSAPVDPLAEGVTVSNADREVQPEAGETSPDTAPVEPPLWTPNSARFLLRDRLETLSLTAGADTVDGGDKPRAAADSKFNFPSTYSSQAVTPPARRTATPRNPAPAGMEPVGPAVPDGQFGDDVPAGLVEELELPDTDGAAGGLIPSEQFNASERISSDSDSFVLDGEHGMSSPASTSLGLNSADTTVGLINPHGTPSAANPATAERTVAEVLRGDASGDEVGSGVPVLSVWRGVAVFLALLAMWFAGSWIAKRFGGTFKVGANKPLSVLETISLGAGRQITIVEMGECALVLGVTPQSINLLDKVPLAVISQSYKGTVNAIIDKESRALPDDWAQQPRFTVPQNTGSSPLVPPLTSVGTYGPNGQRISVSEMRNSRSGAGTQASDAARTRPPARASAGNDEQTKTELIGRLRDQLDRLER